MDKKQRYEIASAGSSKYEKIDLHRFPRNYYEASLKFSDIKNGDTLLKVGTGSGIPFKYFLKKTENIHAIDISENNIIECKKRYGDKINFVVGDMDKKTEFKDNQFDIIVSVDVIEHLENRYNPMVEFNRILKVGGRLMVVTPNLVKLRNRVGVLLGKYPHTAGTDLGTWMYDGGHLNLFTFDTLRELGEQTGFRVTKEYGYGRYGILHNIFRRLLSGSICIMFEKVKTIDSPKK